ncbi:glycerol dehydrogenase [Affinibrenneria salicis]|uniref:Glycerol dehydrogenase n=1 Tax=Affinibrenneria salicis TaxID=2590031 RepID=A0A5J5FYU6_9GAMM|nr:glycerol dehydrogenase [Affinibrenneria salicis]KAA8999398.1 glycerol dehydrogenase [Affinibrenneria salicis]
MKMTPRSISSPGKFLIASGLLDQLDEHLKVFGNNVLVVCDVFFLDRVSSSLAKGAKESGLNVNVEKFGGECSAVEVDRLRQICTANNIEVVVGIGGGKTLDCAKAVSFYENKPVVIVPTLASTDAPCTALSVLYKENGEFDKYLFLPKNPDAVLVDTQVIANAPVRFFAAGVGDALATYFEARACFQADGINLVLKRPSRTGLGIARLCYDILQENIETAMDAVSSKVVTSALEQTIEATIYLSGVGAESGGLAAAHAVSNGMSIVPELHRVQHGEKVTFGLLTQLVLENAPAEEIDSVIRIIKTAGLPLTLADMGLTTIDEKVWREVAKVACAEGDTMSNMPANLSENDVYAAMMAANAMGARYKA